MVILLLFSPKILYKIKKIYKFAAHYNGLIVSFVLYSVIKWSLLIQCVTNFSEAVPFYEHFVKIK